MNNFSTQWLVDVFLPYLEEWEQEALSTPDLGRKEQRKRCLSLETLAGMRISGECSLCVSVVFSFFFFEHAFYMPKY